MFQYEPQERVRLVVVKKIKRDGKGKYFFLLLMLMHKNSLCRRGNMQGDGNTRYSRHLSCFGLWFFDPKSALESNRFSGPTIFKTMTSTKLYHSNYSQICIAFRPCIRRYLAHFIFHFKLSEIFGQSLLPSFAVAFTVSRKNLRLEADVTIDKGRKRQTNVVIWHFLPHFFLSFFFHYSSSCFFFFSSSVRTQRDIRADWS